MEIVRQSGGFLYERGESRASVPQIGGLPYQTVQVDGPVRRSVGFPNKIGNQSRRRRRVFRDGRRHKLKKFQIYGSGGGEGGGLRPEAAVSQMHGNPAVIQRQRHLFRGEVPFRTYQDMDFAASFAP